MSEDKKGSGTHVSSNQSLMEFSDKNFDDTVSGSRPVLVDFWATWCGPCQFMLPIFDKLAKKYGDKVTFGRLNVDDNQGVAMRFDVYAIPTFISIHEWEGYRSSCGRSWRKRTRRALTKVSIAIPILCLSLILIQN